MVSDRTLRVVIKPVVFSICLVPLALLVWRGLNDGLGANPIEASNRFLGDWALRFILIALAVTPIRIMTRWNPIMRFRRMMGLFAFAYVVLHLTSYVALDQFFDWPAIWKDIIKRWYITVGMTAFVLLIPLAVTSTKGWIKRIGGKTWQNLHKLVYPAAILGVFHFYMMIKADFTEPIIYGVILAILFGIRIFESIRKENPEQPDHKYLMRRIPIRPHAGIHRQRDIEMSRAFHHLAHKGCCIIGLFFGTSKISSSCTCKSIFALSFFFASASGNRIMARLMISAAPP